MRLFVRTFWVLTLLAALTGCKKGAEPVRFTADARDWETANPTPLPDGTVIGILSAEPVSIPNVRATVSGREIVPDISFFWESGQKGETPFYGYTPFNPSISSLPLVFSVQEDQSTPAAFAASDLMASSALISPGLNVRFLFHHKMSRLIVKVKGETAETGTVRSVTLREVPRTGTMVEIARGLSDLSDYGNIRALSVTENTRKSFSALFLPVEIKLSLGLETTRDKYYSCSLPATMAFLPGKTYITEIDLSDANVYTGDITFTVTVTDWSDGGSLPF